jgi:hypothetical protein
MRSAASTSNHPAAIILPDICAKDFHPAVVKKRPSPPQNFFKKLFTRTADVLPPSLQWTHVTMKNHLKFDAADSRRGPVRPGPSCPTSRWQLGQRPIIPQPIPMNPPIQSAPAGHHVAAASPSTRNASLCKVMQAFDPVFFYPNPETTICCGHSQRHHKRVKNARNQSESNRIKLQKFRVINQVRDCRHGWHRPVACNTNSPSLAFHKLAENRRKQSRTNQNKLGKITSARNNRVRSKIVNRKYLDATRTAKNAWPGSGDSDFRPKL